MTEPDPSPWASPAVSTQPPPAAEDADGVWGSPPAAAPPAWGPPPAPGPVPPQGWGPPPQGWAPPPYGQQAWPGPGPEVEPRTSPLSIVALVTGLVGLFPVAIPVAVVALVRLRRRHERGRGLAIGGLVAATCWLLVTAVVVAGFLLGGGSNGVVGPVAQAGSMITGSCLQTGDPVDAAVPCGQAHDEEVYDSNVFEGGSYRGRGELAAEADDFCYSSYRPYVGRAFETSRYDYAYYVPDAAEWQAGERRLVCVVVPTDGVLTGSVAGSGR